jgi:hypothetical protein
VGPSAKHLPVRGVFGKVAHATPRAATVSQSQYLFSAFAATLRFKNQLGRGLVYSSRKLTSIVAATVTGWLFL